MLKRLIPFIFFGAVLIFYIHNLTRDIFSGDIGDLVTAACTWGVPHPSGYPLFTVIGGILCRLPLPLPPVSRVGLISVFSSLIALVIFYRYSYKVTKSLLLSILSTAILALSHYFWFHAEIPEVFALTSLFIISILYVSLQFYEKKKQSHLCLLALLLGLSLAHHHTIILLFPSVFILGIVHFRYIFFDLKRLGLCLLFFILGVAVYVYIPIAASHSPPVNWDNAVTVKNFLHLAFRKDYGGYQAKGFIKTYNPLELQTKFIILGNYAKSILTLFSLQGILIGLLGAIKLFRKEKVQLTAFLTALALLGPFFVFLAAINATNVSTLGVIERFYVLSAVVFMFFIPHGFVLIRNVLSYFSKKKILVHLLLTYFFIIPLMMLWYNFPRTNLSSTRIGNNFAKDILGSLPPGAVLFLSNDTPTFNTWYMYWVLRYRRDIDIINPTYGGGNYFLDAQINKYYQKHAGMPLSQVIDNTIDDVAKTRPIFATYTMPQIKGYADIPYGLVHQLVKLNQVPEKTEYLARVNKLIKKYHIKKRNDLSPAENNLISDEIPFLYARSIQNVANFLGIQYQDHKAALNFYTLSVQIDPEESVGYAGMALSYYREYKDCDKAIGLMRRAIELYPILRDYYDHLNNFYLKCKVDKKTYDAFKTNYNKIFNSEKQ